MDLAVKELQEIGKWFPQYGAAETCQMACAYAQLRLARAIEDAAGRIPDLDALQTAFMPVAAAARGPEQLTLSIPDPISAYTASVTAKKLPSL